MKPLGWVFAVVMVATGGVWALQGLGYLEGSPMTDQAFWAVAGSALAGFGLALMLVLARRR